MSGKMKRKKWFRIATYVALILCAVFVIYVIVHFICSETTMGPFLRGEKKGKWFVTEEDGYTITAKRFKLFRFYGEVHVEKTGSNRVVLGTDQKPTCCLFAWRFMSSTDYGLMITTVPEGQGIVAYLIRLSEEGEYISEGILSIEEETFVKSFLEENKQDVLALIRKYKAIGG
ncbi:MAG: hypothetical protein IJL03_11120 [Lachnospiraceae bacterium]|nr:hypothetical protein [Lachnospiraceae bacterium]